MFRPDDWWRLEAQLALAAIVTIGVIFQWKTSSFF